MKWDPAGRGFRCTRGGWRVHSLREGHKLGTQEPPGQSGGRRDGRCRRGTLVGGVAGLATAEIGDDKGRLQRLTNWHSRL
jgi:hypothetical protein